MSVSDLQKLGLLKPESEWNGEGVGRSVAPIRSLLLGVISISGCVGMVLGNGSALTWFSLIAFTLSLFCFVVVHVRQAGSPNEVDSPDPPAPPQPGS